MANTKTKIPRVPNVPSTTMILTRGYDTEKAKKTIRDGEVYFDMNGKTILMGIYQGPYEPIKVVEMSVGGGGGSISPEALADLIKKSDVIQDIDPSTPYAPEKVASASAVSSLKADVISNTSKISVLEGLFKEGSINPEVEKYIKELLAESGLKSSSTITVSPVIDSTSHVEIAVNTDKESLDTVTDNEGNEGLGMVWAAYGDSGSTVSEISETESLATEDEGLNLSANVLS